MHEIYIASTQLSMSQIVLGICSNELTNSRISPAISTASSELDSVYTSTGAFGSGWSLGNLEWM